MLLLAAGALGGATPAAAARLALRQLSLDLPAAPAAIVPVDLDHDGVRDLLVLLVYTRWDQKVVDESVKVDGVKEMVAMMTIVPALLDHRELWFLRGDGHGGYTRTGAPLPMALSVHALMADAARGTALVLTDDGVDAVTWDATRGLALEPRLRAPSRLAGSGAFLPELDLLADVRGDGGKALLFPATDGLRIYALPAAGAFGEPLAIVALPAAMTAGGGPLTVRYPLPEVGDVDGDHHPDLVFRDPEQGWARPWVAHGEGDGRFAAPFAVLAGEPRRDEEKRAKGKPAPPEVAWFGDLDGDGRAEVVTIETQEPPEDAGMRTEIRAAELPHSIVRVYSTGERLVPAASPRLTFPVDGHAFAGEGSDIQLPAGFLDLDHDGRRDLVTIEIGISITRILGGLALGHVAVPMTFHVWCQHPDGGFAPVQGLDLSGKFRVDLAGFHVRSLPSFAGDFDGDGRLDFVQLGNGRSVSVHTSQPGCRFPAAPDLELELRSEPEQLDLVRVADLDGDGRADILVVVPGTSPEAGVTASARLDLYLSGAVR